MMRSDEWAEDQWCDLRLEATRYSQPEDIFRAHQSQLDRNRERQLQGDTGRSQMASPDGQGEVDYVGRSSRALGSANEFLMATAKRRPHAPS
ncbi:hypothetical protein CC1G_14958 [Coprinopsis cinerea okayama7|uniref:Uncharacterized protein n=1 Tax=Coprinopsis cinerea (strain Okayama-7 / 130 / ATCC MYA-4618 / FGSC 9003) TaxID=240176 RepID=D6RP52_COPC7|nr:hypothetical protein CC1G_14958 [Coprinopsis cinerea okayama7\|eukprot:XP_002910627.1 hypothetical protein CC1G_14958 [Coprinopsis cinerea okayama7\